MFSEPHSQTDSGLAPLPEQPGGSGASRSDTRRARQWASAVQIEVALGRAIWAQRGCAVGQALHWVQGNELLAVVDTGDGQVVYRAKLRREKMDQAHMVLRPRSATYTPAGFVRKGVLDVLWQFGYYAPDAIEQLPPRIFQETLVIRHQPNLTPDLLTLRHAAVLDALGHKPQTPTQLAELLGMPVAQLAKAITPLYVARSVTTRSGNVLTRTVARVRRLVRKRS